jgi:hypothetical protein
LRSYPMKKIKTLTDVDIRTLGAYHQPVQVINSPT